jgi:hypothetical protein
VLRAPKTQHAIAGVSAQAPVEQYTRGSAHIWLQAKATLPKKLFVTHLFEVVGRVSLHHHQQAALGNL